MVAIHTRLLIVGLALLFMVSGARFWRPADDKENTDDESPAGNGCGYRNCPRTQPNKINVHLVPHSHDDVGWLKTVDQYYYGTRKQYAWPGVQYILDSVIPQLVLDRSKRFVYVEMSFFSKWWQEQNEPMRQQVRNLVNQGQLEFINGGWCMNDEATTTYQSIIDQMTIGLKFLEETFGQCARPKVGWQIDPFGHSGEQASLFAQFGFDGMFFERIDYKQKLSLAQQKSLDLLWHGDSALQGDTGSIYANVFIDGYDSPSTFCFDTYCLDPNLVDNNRSLEYNIEERVSSFAGYVNYYAKHKLTNHIMIPMGGDFQYTSAHQNFRNLDKLIAHLNRMRPELNAFYSTPSCYQWALNQAGRARHVVWPEKMDDFFPYSSDAHAYWTGYFTSRPAVKLFERQASTVLQLSRQVTLAKLIGTTISPANATTNSNNNNKPLEDPVHEWNRQLQLANDQCLEPLWQIMGDLQHHDAVTGTEKQHVSDDYLLRGTEALNRCLSTTVNVAPGLNGGGSTLWCPALNISHCWATEYYLGPDQNQGLRVMVFNPLAESLVHTPIRLPCPVPCDLTKISVRELSTSDNSNNNSNNNNYQLTEVQKFPLNAGLEKLPFRVSLADEELQLYASVPPVGYTVYEVSVHNHSDASFNSVESNLETQLGPQPDPYRLVYNSHRWIRTKANSNGNMDLASLLANGESHIMKIPFGSRYEQQFEEHQQQQQYLNLNLKTGLIEGIGTQDDYLEVKQQFGYYLPYTDYRPSGAYILRTLNQVPTIVEQPVKFKIYKTKYVYEIHQQWNDWIWQTIRADAFLNYIEYDYVVGPLPIIEDKKVGLEVFARYSTNLSTSGVFYTDSNGRQLMVRRRVPVNMTEEWVAANHYPVTTTMLLKDPTPTRPIDMAIFTDRAQAGTSLRDGDLQLLIHRRLLMDDNFGVGEPLNEPGEDGRGLVVRGQHRLMVEFLPKTSDDRVRIKKRADSLGPHPATNTFSDHQETIMNISTDTSLLMDPNLDQIRQQSIRFLLKPVLTFEPIKKASSTANSLGSSYRTSAAPRDSSTGSLINVTLPSNVHLLTLQPWKDRQVLIRLENTQNPMTFHRSLYPDNYYKQMLALYKEEPQLSMNSNNNGNNKFKDPQQSRGSSEDTTREGPSTKCKRLRSHFQRSKYNGRYYTHRLPCARFLNNEQSPASESISIVAGRCLDRRSPLGDPIKFDIEYLLRDVRVVSLQEMTLGANMNLNQLTRLDWNTTYVSDSDVPCDSFTPLASDTNGFSPTSVTLGPRQIRTYLARIDKI